MVFKKVHRTMTVLLRECKRHTDRGVSTTPSSVLYRGYGCTPTVPGDTPSLPHTYPHPDLAGGVPLSLLKDVTPSLLGVGESPPQVPLIWTWPWYPPCWQKNWHWVKTRANFYRVWLSSNPKVHRRWQYKTRNVLKAHGLLGVETWEKDFARRTSLGLA